MNREWLDIPDWWKSWQAAKWAENLRASHKGEKYRLMRVGIVYGAAIGLLVGMALGSLIK